MKQVGKILLLAVLAVALSAPAWAKKAQQQKAPTDRPAAIMMKAGEVTATVVSINQETRMVELKFPDGHTETIKAGPEVQRLNMVAKGDQVHMQYVQSVAIAVDKKGTKVATGDSTEVEMATVNGKPAKRVVNTIQMAATVTDINYDNRMVKLRNSTGEIKEFKVGDNVKRLNEVKKGDEVVVRVTESFAVSVTKG